MAGLVYPYTIQNDTTADGDQVQEQFDAVKDFLATTGIDTGGIPYAKLLLSNSITSGDIVSDAVTADEIAAPSIGVAYPASDVPSAGLDTPVSLCGTGALTGFYLASATVVYKRPSVAAGVLRMRSRLYRNVTQIGAEMRSEIPIATPGGDGYFSHSHFAFQAMAGESFVLQADSYQAGTFLAADARIFYIRLA